MLWWLKALVGLQMSVDPGVCPRTPSEFYPRAINLYRLTRFEHNDCPTPSLRLGALLRSRIMDDRRKNYRAWGALQQGAAKATFLISLVNCTIQANGLSAD